MREERASVAPERSVERAARLERVQGLDELLERVVVETRAAPQALPAKDVTPAVDEDRAAERPGLEHDHRQALEVRRHHQQIGRGDRVELVLVWHESQVADPRVRRHRDHRAADEHERQAPRKRRRVPGEVLEELLAALVLVDAAHVDRKRLADPELPAESLRVGALRHLGSDAHHHRRHVAVGGDGVDHGALFERVVHDRADAAEHGAEQAHAHGRIPLGRRDEDRLAIHRARAVTGVVVAVAEEDEEVVGLAAPLEVLDERRAGRPFAVEPLQLVGERVRLVEDADRSAPELLGIPRMPDRKPPHRDAVDRLDARGELVPPRHVVASARGQHLDLVVPRQVLRDVPRVQLGAAVDVGAVALDDDRELHGS